MKLKRVTAILLATAMRRLVGQRFQPVGQTPAGIHPLQGGCGAGRCAGLRPDLAETEVNL